MRNESPASFVETLLKSVFHGAPIAGVAKRLEYTILDKPNDLNIGGRIVNRTMEPEKPTDVVAHTLRITAAPWEEFQQEALEKVEEVIEDGTNDNERIIAFEDAGSIQRVLTPKRLELIKSVMEDPPDSMRQLASRLERSPSEVHNDVHLLEEYGIIEIQEAGRSKQPIVPYESIKIEVELSLSRDSDDAIATA